MDLTYTAYCDAGRAVDGNTDPVWHWDATNSLSHTLADNPSWWEVDLGDVYRIGSVVLHNRESCCQSRLRDIPLVLRTT